MTALRRDHELLVLGEIFSALNKKLGEDIGEVEREQLITRWFETIDGMCSVEAQSTAGRKVKASAIITFFARTGDIHKLALSLAGDILASS
jgi:hypothetical protein